MGYEPIELPGCSTPRQDSRSADVVGAEGLEPSRPLRTADFKSDVSTNSTTRPSRAPAPPSQVAVAYKRLSHGRWVVKTEATLPALTPEDTACRPCSRTRASVRAVRGPACRLFGRGLGAGVAGSAAAGRHAGVAREARTPVSQAPQRTLAPTCCPTCCTGLGSTPPVARTPSADCSCAIPTNPG